MPTTVTDWLAMSFYVAYFPEFPVPDVTDEVLHYWRGYVLAWILKGDALTPEDCYQAWRTVESMFSGVEPGDYWQQPPSERSRFMALRDTLVETGKRIKEMQKS